MKTDKEFTNLKEEIIDGITNLLCLKPIAYGKKITILYLRNHLALSQACRLQTSGLPQKDY